MKVSYGPFFLFLYRSFVVVLVPKRVTIHTHEIRDSEMRNGLIDVPKMVFTRPWEVVNWIHSFIPYTYVH